MKIRIIALGDSLTEGYPFRQENSWVNLLAAQQDWDLLNKGINGETTDEMLGRFQRDVIHLKPQIVVITGGANDVFQQVPIEVVQENYRRMVELAKAHGILPILGITLPIDEAELENELQQLRKFIVELAQGMLIPVIDFYSGLVDPEQGGIAQCWDYDGVHPNPNGYQRMAEIAQPVIASAVNRMKWSQGFPLGMYQHYKGNFYQVLGVAKHSETLEDLVVYQAMYGDGGLWVRPLAMFNEYVALEGKQVQRFTLVGNK